MISRINERKDWRKEFDSRLTAYQERLVTTQEVQRQIDVASAVVDTKIASKFIFELLGNAPTGKGKSETVAKLVCRHTLENVTPPADPLPWKKSWGSQILCSICSKPSISDCTVCRRCNIIAHNQCIMDVGLKIEAYDCPDCHESIQSEQDHYTNLIARLKHERNLEREARKIAKRLIIVVEKRRLARKRRSAILLQAVVRRFLARKRYLKWLRTQLKLVTVKVTHLPQAVLEDGVVVLTVYDTLKNSQSFRLDATAEEAMKEGFMIPGMGANLSLLLTLARREDFVDGRRQYVMLGQAQLTLRDVVDFTKKNNFDVNFLEKVKWPPIESKGEFKYHLISFSASLTAQSGPAGIAGIAGGSQMGSAAHFSSGASLSGSIGSATVLPSINNNYFYSNNSNNGSARLSGLNSPGHGGGSIFSSNGSVVSTLNTVSGASVLAGGSYSPSVASLTAASSGGGGTAAYSVNPVARALFAADRLCSLCYYPQNPVTNMVAMCSGPPLDILRRASEVGIKKMKNMNSGVNYRNSRYWLCLYRLKLLFFQYFGDTAPRLVADVSQANAVILLDSKGRKTALVNVVHADMRLWLLEFDTKKEAVKFEFALQESRKACENSSIFAQKSEILSSDGQFEYKVGTVY